jgi:UDP-glucose 4-epimerase
MLKVLEAARKAGVKRFVFVSSAAVYGSSPVIPTKESEPFSPESPYALHKIIAEEYLSIYSKLYNMETVALRYFNVYGSRQKPDSPYSGVISIFMNKAKSGEKITIEGDGEQTRDFVHVSDVAKATVCAGSVDGISTEVLNIGSGEEISINILAETINKITGNSAGTVHVESRVGDVRNSVSDSSRAREVLGWKSEIFHEEGLKQLAGA